LGESRCDHHQFGADKVRYVIFAGPVPVVKILASPLVVILRAGHPAGVTSSITTSVGIPLLSCTCFAIEHRTRCEVPGSIPSRKVVPSSTTEIEASLSVAIAGSVSGGSS